MPGTQDFPLIFERLKANFAPYLSALVVEVDNASHFSLNTPASRTYPKGVFFGAARIGKRYVSYHLMPIYACPDLLARLSEPLRKRMQGKSCFNFTTLDETLLDELSQLTAAGFERFQRAEIV
jgi:hypothetical protein